MKVYMPDREWPEHYREVLDELAKITDPVTGGDILDSGVVAGLEVADDALKVWLNFESHAEYNITGESAIAYSKIIGDIIERFALVKFQNVYVYDLKNNPVGVFENKKGYTIEDISTERV
ncbi:iron-sulfur cluster assembly protein [Thermococcus aciditolerans]|uniref:Iron-sulfur cluster assembly protein n=1 Tax=Thermococcus aciditolerans TaxID=2598455 RepID=A0A5C0SMX3_9EURY|nr:iron-sulfur cluster assembly protein [Thermococcus aciditolerans]QEK15745.1 iron-sulfur cluster assembly protein [Thermococcus aciditolerans]